MNWCSLMHWKYVEISLLWFYLLPYYIYIWMRPENCVNSNFFQHPVRKYQYFSFYTFQLEISSCTSKLNTFSTFTHVMSQKQLKPKEFIKLNHPLLSFSTIFVTEKVKHLFLQSYKIQLFHILRHQIAILKVWISFKSFSLLNPLKIPHKCT